MRWRRTKTGHLMISKGSKLRKAEQLKDACPSVAAYLVKHAQWTRATKLLDSFGKTLKRWVDEDGHARGQARVFAAWTGRQSCVDPNLTNQPREEAFRALWVAKPGRKLVIADYSQIELRLLAITAGDERLREVYREGRDVHQETADIFRRGGHRRHERKKAKNVNFALCYGAGVAGLVRAVRVRARRGGQDHGRRVWRLTRGSRGSVQGRRARRRRRGTSPSAPAGASCTTRRSAPAPKRSTPRSRAVPPVSDAGAAADLGCAARERHRRPAGGERPRRDHPRRGRGVRGRGRRDPGRLHDQGAHGDLSRGGMFGLARLTAAGIVDRWLEKP